MLYLVFEKLIFYNIDVVGKQREIDYSSVEQF